MASRQLKPLELRQQAADIQHVQGILYPRLRYGKRRCNILATINDQRATTLRGSGLWHLEMFQEGHCLTDMEVKMSTFLTALAAGAGFVAGMMVVYILIIAVGTIAVWFTLNKKEG